MSASVPSTDARRGAAVASDGEAAAGAPRGAGPSGDATGTLLAAADGAALGRAWLVMLATEWTAAQSALLLLEPPTGDSAPLCWPDEAAARPLGELALAALRARAARTEALRGRTRLALPLPAGSGPGGVVVLEFGAVDAAALRRAQAVTGWGAGWLVDALRQRELQAARARLARGGALTDTLLDVLAQRSPREAALTLVNRVGRAFDSPQVQLARADGPVVRHLALSHSAWFDERSALLLAARQAMQESVDQAQPVHWPPAQPHSAGAPVDAAHRRYAEQSGSAAVLGLPLLHDERVVAVLLLERARPFDADERAALQALALALAPALSLHREAALGATARGWRSLREAVAFVAGPRWPAAKLLGAVAGMLLLLGATLPLPFRIAAPAVVEGAVQRAAVAPFDGFLREAPARAGDVVRAGQLLARLDDRDLRLERLRWEAELELAQRREREAMAAGKAVDQRLAAAQGGQARAQLDLAGARLARADVVAPFDGVVVKGDLSQQLGSPVEQGRTLFELAPLTAWRVVLKVDERDIGHVAVGATGELVLASQPGRRWPFVVRQLTPVSVAEDGRNFFRVEADLGPAPAAGLRPNMEGVAKVDSGRASLLWNWARPLLDWWRLAWWRLWP